jgi:hypothetical protein
MREHFGGPWVRTWLVVRLAAERAGGRDMRGRQESSDTSCTRLRGGSSAAEEVRWQRRSA